TAAALYGANASGKSNVLSALFFMREAVLLSMRVWDAKGGIPRTPFGWGSKPGEPSTFEVTYIREGTKYQYGFVVDDTLVAEEWLYAWPNGRKQIWFEREGDNFSFGSSLEGQNEVTKKVTRGNALFLSVAAQLNQQQLLPVFEWFRDISPVNVHDRSARSASELTFAWETLGPTDRLLRELESGHSSNIMHAMLLRLLKEADFGIVDLRIIEGDEGTSLGASSARMQLKHQSDDDGSWIDLDEESGGTKALSGMAVPIFRTLQGGNLLLVDELEASLHPLLALAILQLFNNPKSNPRNAQIVFTTHDTNLLGGIVGDAPLRRDQIWLTEKGKDGGSRLYPLTDYKPRKHENLERGYLQGRYGSAPFLGDMGSIAR
ncbi:MAG TPA: ATP-binding protein, partial [Pirellulales bacterium]|nr:ATP-binding protein [Pirellulales bacterium]